MTGAVSSVLAQGEREERIVEGFAMTQCGVRFIQAVEEQGWQEAAAVAEAKRLVAGALNSRDPAYGPLCLGDLIQGRCDGQIQ
jgi:hypothetical protein